MEHIARGNLALGAALTMALTITSAVAAPADRWPMYQGNAGHTGYVPRTLLPASARSLWSAQAQNAKPSGLAVSDGYVFTTPTIYFSQSSPLVAQSLADGQILWSLDFGPVFSVNQPAVELPEAVRK